METEDTSYPLVCAINTFSSGSKIQVKLLFLQLRHWSGDARTQRRLPNRQDLHALAIRLRWSTGTLGRERLDELFLTEET